MHYDHQHHCPVNNTMSETFTYFPKLPAEIRSMIWEYSLPEERVYEVLDAPNAKLRTPARQGLMFANVHPEPPPALAAVCRESRYFVLHHYKPLTLGATTKYVDLSRDILLLEPYLLVKRLHRTLHFMSQIPLIRDNINRLALGTSYGVYTGICHPVLSWKVSKTNMGKMLSGLAKFPRLKLLIFIVHQEFQFEFDFRYPPSLGYPHHPHHPLHSHHPHHHPISSTGPDHGLYFPPPGNHPGISPSGAAVVAAPPPTAPPPPPTQLIPLLPLPRPQLVHQAYRFKFDIEANINHTPRRPHLNELLYYPLDVDEDKDDWDLNDEVEESEWFDPWPTNDDWRRFRRRFQRAINLSLEMDLVGGLKGASLLWRYTRGTYG
ncbi:hypothetical protein QBC33DRAFT_377418 [Phialemonium atrogriseum]|uniref:2EXR domain-containing protein n=1 Tax=Phialemonium atrogriseum TaxID=1093897 RepID=A0AAJ0C2R9_9PEZI|nr:uncharacterized protein QBC33DRAFT_377418 [Phialemonium atrogriseum]KAK1768437.1 hypothetical protein QBC33DRAFT_377418 [Phialemonium atrogriseum]